MKPSAEALAQAAEALQQALQRLHIPFDEVQFTWAGIQPLEYKEHAGDAPGMGWRGVTRYSLGRPPYVEARFALRYFEIEPDGYSSLEKHAHVHLVVVIRGRGRALVGERVFELKPFDVLYVPPNTPHRWVNPYSEPFGFLCPADAERDKPQPISDAEWDALRANPETAPYVF
ncbi:MAG: cupin [Armatimonadetes bacterium JP3_11]|jgi:quercetin dioxygenase-like cupin family protein|nr:MAG: cupin [Armatimonadetes bacterium CP1_7O]OYT74439.1 MAG: cupin [Armatimonadetes bacterium JP3_11]RMH09797.1 MAG: cupin domain-containing protein [Armatimonadota bacterium]